ncbi:MAG: hypothetical protein U0491_00705 [Candidatus Saccharimonadales bacterium]
MPEKNNIAPIIDGNFTNLDFISTKQLSKPTIDILFEEVDSMREIYYHQKGIDLLPHYQIDIKFDEPSTRTLKSFVAAAQRLGASVLYTPDKEFSSVSKGESWDDDILANAQYADATVMRHPQTGKVGEAANLSPVPVLNGGDGIGEHPSQAGLDLYTIRQKLGGVKGKTITAVGDLFHGRTVKSLADIAATESEGDLRINFVAPEDMQMSQEVITDLRGRGVDVQLFDEIEEPLRDTDALYVVRMQRERFGTQEDASIGEDTLAKIKKILQFGSEQHKRLMTPGFVDTVTAMSRELDLLDEHSDSYKKLYADFIGLRYAIPDVKVIQTNTSPTDNPYVITPELLRFAKEKMILMHPFPRVGEIDIRCDSDPRAVYLTDQMKNGMFVRMALLARIMGKTTLAAA